MVYEGRLICFWFSNSWENFGQIDIWWYPTYEVRLRCNLGSKKWFLPRSAAPAVNISIMKAKHRNSNRSNSLESSAESESVIRLILNAVFEEIVFSCRNFFSVIFPVKINPSAFFKYRTYYGTRRYSTSGILFRSQRCVPLGGVVPSATSRRLLLRCYTLDARVE